MAKRKARRWFRLENASKIFPPNSKGRDTNVFRMACVLKDPVDPDILQAALNLTLPRFPFYQSILRKGFFWMYFEQTTLTPKVHPENRPPCSRLYNPDIKSLLFDVSFYQNRVNLEVFHALSDGAGALHFLQHLIWEYILLRYSYDKNEVESIFYDASNLQKEEDSFSRRYRPNHEKSEKGKRITAYQEKLSYLPESRIQIVTGHASVKECLSISKSYGASLTEYLATTLLLAYNDTLSWKDRKKPVVLAIPVNLRRFFQSETTRNFFSLVYVHYTFSKEDESFADILQSVQTQFLEKVTLANLSKRVQMLVQVEQNPFVRGIPLILKNFGLRIANNYVQKESTTTLSNVGKITMPDFCAPHIRGFDVYISTERTQLTLCSYADSLSLNFSTSFSDLELQKYFFRRLTKDGLSVSLSTSQRPMKEES